MSQQPLAPPPPSGNSGQDRWLFLLWKRISAAGQILWSQLDFTGSNITDILTRNHADLQNLNTASYTHLTSTQATDLTDGGATTLHKHDHATQDNLNSTDYTHLTATQAADLTDGGLSALHQHDMTLIQYPAPLKVGDPAHIDTLQEVLNHQWSSGVVDGCDITDNGDGTISFGTGTAVLRASADPHTSLYVIALGAQATLALTDDATNYVYLDWNAGSPQFVASTSISSFNCLDKCIAYLVHRDGTTLTVVDAREQNVDGNRKSRRLFLQFSRFIHLEGGSVLSDAGTLHVAVTAGGFNFMLEEILHIAFDTSVAGTAAANVFTLYYQDGVGGWTAVPNSKTITSTTYDAGTGTPATLGNNKFGVTWFYIINDSPSFLVAVMGQAEYANQAEAEVASSPSLVPSIVSGLGSLIGFVVYEKSATEFADVLSAFSTVFTASAATNHNALAGLQGGTAGSYYHSNQAINTTDSPTFAGATLAGNLTFSGTARFLYGDFSNATLSSRTTIKTSTANDSTLIPIVPNGTGTSAGLQIYNSSDPSNASRQYFYITAGTSFLVIDKTGTGSYIPFNLYVGGLNALAINTSGNTTVRGLTATTFNGNTWTTGTGTLTQAAGSTLTTVGSFGVTLTATATTSVTLPTSGTLATTTYFNPELAAFAAAQG